MRVFAEWKAGLDKPEEMEEASGNGQTRQSPRAVTAGEMEAWLTERISARLRIPRSQVHVATPFVEFGMSSMDAVAIAVDLERWLGRPLSPTAIYNYPTISTLARWLAGQPAGPRPANGAPPRLAPEDPDTAQFDRELRQMTAEEMEQFASIVEEMSRQEGQ